MPQRSLIKLRIFLMSKIFNYTFLVAVLLCILNSKITLADSSCPPKPSLYLQNKELKQLGSIKPPGLVAAQGVLSFFDGDINKVALTTGYWDNNITIFSGANWTDVAHRNLSAKSPSGLIASVYEQNGKLWWTSYREGVVFVTDLTGKLIFRLDMPDLAAPLAGPVGLTGDPKTGLIFIPRRDKEGTLYVINELQPSSHVTLKIKGMSSDPYDIDQQDGCIFLVESNEAKIWTLETRDVIEQVAKAKANKDKFFANIFSSYTLEPKVWFSNLKRPQHQFIHDGVLHVIDTDDFSVVKIGLHSGAVQKFILPIQHIFRGLTVTQNGNILLTGFQDIIEINEQRTAIFIMK